MAYLVDLVNRCSYVRCPKRAVVQVMDRWNSSCGSYCRKHGKIRLAEVERGEQAVPV